MATEQRHGAGSSRKCLLGHDDVEILWCDLHLRLILACPPNYFRDLLHVKPLPELFADLHDILDDDHALAISIEKSEDLVDFFLRIFLILPLLPGHQIQELLEIQGRIAVLVQLREHLEDRVVFALIAERLHRSLELLEINLPRLIGIEEVKGLFDLLDLVLLQAGPLILTGLEILVPAFRRMHRGRWQWVAGRGVRWHVPWRGNAPFRLE
eukprot:CAMPEP_0117538088 /NCGR_PEP_ID=MMETSP0784-20121206/42301_1 /TAXON_ID=39447 /ORGANISM="" /LENGTH=210 /DNA_ID=CAMNT_0005334697 /DNA_START=311 /DNA_END=940 /DNA_ORIENTATION=-